MSLAWLCPAWRIPNNASKTSQKLSIAACRARPKDRDPNPIQRDWIGLNLVALSSLEGCGSKERERAAEHRIRRVTELTGRVDDLEVAPVSERAREREA